MNRWELRNFMDLYHQEANAHDPKVTKFVLGASDVEKINALRQDDIDLLLARSLAILHLDTKPPIISVMSNKAELLDKMLQSMGLVPDKV